MKETVRRILLPSAAVSLSFWVAGCPNRELGPVEPLVQSGTSIVITQAESDAVDLLVVIDNSHSMQQEQANLTANFPELIRTLTDPPVDDNNQPLYPPVADLHIGVVSTDMGTGGYAVTTCDDSIDGDDGILINTPRGNVANCAVSYPSYLEWDEENPNDNIDEDFTCLATLGTEGCGFEQQLKAATKALTVHSVDGGANAGFVRRNSLLAVLILTDEEDCSVREDSTASDIFNTQLQLGPLNLRCYNHRNYVEPVDTFVDDLLALRADNPERLVVAAIAGIPPSGGDNNCNLENMSDSDFSCILDLPKMQEVIDNSQEGGGERLTPSCDVPGLGEAFPPRRIVEFVQRINEVGNNGIVRSICEADLRPAMRAITSLIQSKVLGACLARPLNVNDEGQVQCIINETLTNADDCPDGAIDLGVSGGQRRCQLCQQGDGTGTRLVDELGTDLTPCARFSSDYWRYIPGTEATDCASTGKVAFEGHTVPPPGAVVRLECLSRVEE